MNTHAQRWLTAAAVVPALFAVIAWGGETLFFIVIVTAILLGVNEYNAMVLPMSPGSEKIQTLLISLLIPVIFFLGSVELLLCLLAFSIPAVFILHLLRIRQEHYDVLPVMKIVFGTLYVSLLLSHLIWLRRGEDGALWIFFVIVLAFSGDVAAYYVGRTWGRRKLMPLVSAGKTVEGVAGLIAGSALGCLIFSWLFLPVLFPWHAVILGVFGSVLGQLGDLCESLLKRAAGVKDSGTLLPGHGGILDRLDCLLFIAPTVYYYRYYFLP
ncbi:MAG TPA: phosphatidate cytidylyltransferase [Syntrophales bacterium]|nr:phosphatidate cytidylyltransferase [Syntrophales bacterium]HON24254.1 phosphatidate cytidylyltransferase [Syntrophales bacterium]HOU77110.1 phosphatidate cytidylyltransferase [Syntrophales bacterium]HPC32790.1 phosphatidate cytidylyltransferase [Syntrophales bacterium]HQG33638.1 phosphatidate cytidylyltransferase [Syntrophales bacterium]